jgi:hypothetical protein
VCVAVALEEAALLAELLAVRVLDTVWELEDVEDAVEDAVDDAVLVSVTDCADAGTRSVSRARASTWRIIARGARARGRDAKI